MPSNHSRRLLATPSERRRTEVQSDLTEQRFTSNHHPNAHSSFSSPDDALICLDNFSQYLSLLTSQPPVEPQITNLVQYLEQLNLQVTALRKDLARSETPFWYTVDHDSRSQSSQREARERFAENTADWVFAQHRMIDQRQRYEEYLAETYAYVDNSMVENYDGLVGLRARGAEKIEESDGDRLSVDEALSSNDQADCLSDTSPSVRSLDDNSLIDVTIQGREPRSKSRRDINQNAGEHRKRSRSQVSFYQSPGRSTRSMRRNGGISPPERTRFRRRHISIESSPDPLSGGLSDDGLEYHR